MWLVPAVLAPLIIRKPGAALFAELVAASISALLGSQWGPDTLLSGFIQGAAAELVFAVTGYRRWSMAVLAVAAVASALGAWAHDWWLYYADVSIELQVAAARDHGRLGDRVRRVRLARCWCDRSGARACCRDSRTERRSGFVAGGLAAAHSATVHPGRRRGVSRTPGARGRRSGISSSTSSRASCSSWSGRPARARARSRAGSPGCSRASSPGSGRARSWSATSTWRWGRRGRRGRRRCPSRPPASGPGSCSRIRRASW